MPLPDDWHADHVVPWVVSRRTNVHEMQALCPECNLRKGDSMQQVLAAWEDILAPTQAFSPREGHLRAYEWAACVGGPERIAIELVTGYGKTVVAYGLFEILRHRGLVDRMLVFVPGDEQRRQFVDDETKAKEMFSGARSRAWAITKEARDFTVIRRNEADVFVACYQQLSDRDQFFLDLTSQNAKWFVVLDEYHHLYEDGRWAKRQEAISAPFRSYMSATPERSDRKKTHATPATPIVSIGYQDAYREEAVRLVVCHNEHYQVHCEGPDGESLHFSTADLLQENVEDFQSFEVRRQLRYKRDYLDWMLLDPIQKLQQKQIMHPPLDGKIQHQMIVFAMSCKHADYVCGTIRELASYLNGNSLSCEWIGVGEGLDGRVKSDHENKAIIDRFRAGTLDVLVQVNKCGEGFSINTASVLVFLNLVKAQPFLFQQIGRGLRRNHNLAFEDDQCDIFVSADSPVAQLVQTMEVEALEVKEKGERDDGEDGDDPHGNLFDIPDITVIRSEHTYREVVTPGGMAIVLSEEDRAFAERWSIPPDELLRHNESRGRRSPVHTSPNDARRSKQERLEAIAGQVEKSVSMYVGNVIKLLRGCGRTIDKKLAGSLKQKIHGQWNRVSGMQHDAMLEDDFRRKHAWLQELNNQLKSTKGLPTWLS